jgi:hypothetical protein
MEFCMPNFESPISNKRFAATPLKDIDIPDESENYSPRHSMNESSIREMQMRMNHEDDREPSEIEREIKAAKEARRTGKERLSDGAKRRIEILLGMTRSIHKVDIDGNIFIFQSLKAKEMREAIIAAAEYDGTVQSPFEIRKQFLARSITSIADVDFEQFIGSNTLEAKLLFIEELDDALSNRLYDEYIKMAKDARDKFSIKSDVDGKEVVEDLKK